MPNDEIVFVVEEDREVGGFVASCYREGIFTQGDTMDDLRRAVREAVACRFEDERDRPGRIRLHVLRDEIIPA